jgi:hypothetical protein
MIVDWVSWPNLHTVEGMNRPLLMASVMVAWSCALCEKGYILFKLSWNRNFESLHLWTLILGVGEGLIQSRCKGTFKRFWYREDMQFGGYKCLPGQISWTNILYSRFSVLRLLGSWGSAQASNLTIQSMLDAELPYFSQTVQRAQDIRRSWYCIHP